MTDLEWLFHRIRELEGEVNREIQKKKEEYYYTIKKKRVEFEKNVLREHRQIATAAWRYVLSASPLAILTAPVIYSMLIPAVILDLFLMAYQWICFPAYGIPKVKRREHIVIDRQYLGYLNIIEKINCIYCGYFNGLMSFATEVAGRTEQYWCPIKHARKITSPHSRYRRFFEYGDGKDYRKRLGMLSRDFEDLKGSQEILDFQI